MIATLSPAGNYTFRFESIRSDGRRLTYTTTLACRSEADGRARLAAMLGCGRYDIRLLSREPAAIPPIAASESTCSARCFPVRGTTATFTSSFRPRWG
jgi:hypothetical protein